MYIPKTSFINFAQKPVQIERSRLDFCENHDLKIEEISFLDDKVVIGRAPGKPQYPKQGDNNPNNYTFDTYTISRDIEFLKNHCGVDTIIDLRNPKYEGNKFSQAEKEACEKQDVNYFNIPLDSGIAPTQEEIDKFFNIIDNSDKVYIHCHAGRDRTGIMSSCYLAKTYGQTQDEAFQKVFDKRNIQRLKFMSGQPQECEKLSQTLTNLSQAK